MPLRGTNSYSTYYRLLLDKILDESIERVLYIDVDTLTKGDVRTLIDNTNLDGKILAGVKDYLMQGNDKTGSKRVCKSRLMNLSDIEISIDTYFNAGMLLINMVEWRKRDIGNKSLSIVNNYDLVANDQDLLNYLIDDPVFLDCSWNFMPAYFSLSFNKSTNLYDAKDLGNGLDSSFNLISNGINAREYEVAAESPNIIHYTVVKPWNYKHVSIYGGLDFYGELYGNAIKDWALTAVKVEEFSSSLAFAKQLAKLNNISEQAKIKYLSETIKILKESIDRTRDRDQKRLRKKLYALILLNICTWILVGFLI